jgi:hypothetical protein
LKELPAGGRIIGATPLEDFMCLRTSAAASLASKRRRHTRGKDMYETGFDVDAIAKRLKTTFPVEQSLPMRIKLALAHLMRAEDEAAQGR